MDRVPLLSPKGKGNVSHRDASLEIIEGIEPHDVLRLEEMGIDTCYDLATVDFVPLVLKTPYSARQLIDWILQAKLCIYFEETVKDLRQAGIRTIMDLESLQAAEIEALSKATRVTQYALTRAQESVKSDAEVKHLIHVGHLLGRFSSEK